METKRLNFSLLEHDDLENLFLLHSDPDVMKYIRKPDTHRAQTLQMIERVLQNAHIRPGLEIYCCRLKADPFSFIGWGLVKFLQSSEKNSIELGYRIHKNFWGQGYATEITKELILHTKLFFPSKKITAITNPNNAASEKVLIKSGFRYIGDRIFNKELCRYFEL